ncbi:hypothetical protein AAFC00_003802 [Neodothiora populina]
MKFREDVGADGHPDVTFLYEVGEGVAHRSYGLNVARLAGVPTSVLDVAAVQSKKMEDEGAVKRLVYLSRMLGGLVAGESESEQASAALEALVAAVQLL